MRTSPPQQLQRDLRRLSRSMDFVSRQRRRFTGLVIFKPNAEGKRSKR